jgi:UDP-N-acetylmuramate dehydrogenase
MTVARNYDGVRGELLRDEPLARHTSWHVGGPADIWFKPADRDDLALFLNASDPELDLLWVGLGSNLLVRDGGWRGAVIATHQALDRIERTDALRVYAEAGVPCARLAKVCARYGLGSAAFFAGIPGTIGGALTMNAGAFGGETWQFVSSLETVDRKGRFHRRSASDYRVGYRSVQGPADEAASGDEIRELLARRKASQPIGQPSCGSVFRNPEGDHAARLIEATGLKGLAVGKAQVSPKHANFIVNLGGASAAEVEALIRLVQGAVANRFDVRLVPEVRVVGEYQ